MKSTLKNACNFVWRMVSSSGHVITERYESDESKCRKLLLLTKLWHQRLSLPLVDVCIIRILFSWKIRTHIPGVVKKWECYEVEMRITKLPTMTSEKAFFSVIVWRGRREKLLTIVFSPYAFAERVLICSEDSADAENWCYIWTPP